MNTYAEEIFLYLVNLFKEAHHSASYSILKETDASFHVQKENITSRYEKKDLYASELARVFPENQYAVIYRGFPTRDAWMIYIKHGVREFRWHISLHDGNRRLLTEGVAFHSAKKRDFPHVDDILTHFLTMMREMKEYRLYFLTGVVREG